MPEPPAHLNQVVDDVLGHFARSCPNARDHSARRPAHAAIARVWLLADAWVLRARTLEVDTVACFLRECALLDRVRPLLPYRLPEPLESDDGTRHVLADGALWTLHPALPGRILRPWQELHRAPEDQRRLLVQTLRTMHDRTAGRLGPADARWLANDVRQRYGGVRDLLSPVAQDRVQVALSRHAAEAARTSSREAVFVHGDFHGGNLLLDDGGRVTGLVDLDWCRVAGPIEDLAYTAMMLVRDYDAPRPRMGEVDRVLTWYGLDPSRRGAFDDALVLYALFDVHLFRNAVKLGDRDRFLRYQVGLLETICANGRERGS